MEKERIASFLNTPINLLTVAGKGAAGDLYGLELELEGKNVAIDGQAVRGWKQDHDGSLRGESVEFVFSKPCVYEEAVERVERLFEMFVKSRTRIKKSYRCSTHIHLNFADKTVKQVVNLFVLYTILEELLETYCGDERTGNLFSLSSRHVEPIVDLLERATTHHLNLKDFGERVRYCAVNLSALNKFGSIELRTMRGAENAKMVIEWMDICRQMYEFATQKMVSPAKLIEDISMRGVDNWIYNIFDDKTARALIASWEGHGSLRQSLYEGIRLVQVLAYRLEEAYQIEAKPMVPKVGERRKIVPRNGRGNVYGVTGPFEHGDIVKGVPRRIWFDAGAGAWYDEERDQWYDFVD